MSGDLPKTPRPSGARIAGDDYQHLYTWLHALQLLREQEGVTRVEFEVRDAGNVDDLIVRRRNGPTLYHQIKFGVDHRDALTAEWFIAVPNGGRTTPLQRFYKSFNDLTVGAERPELALLTSRRQAAGDPILQHLDSRTDKLGPRFYTPRSSSETGVARKAWADHLDVSEDELQQMLEHFRIYPNRGSLEELRRNCGIYMEAVSLRGDDAAVVLGANEIRQLIIDGCDALEQPEMNELVDRLGLRAALRRATLGIQAIDRHPWPETSVFTLDWIDEFLGSEPRERRQTRDPRVWNGRFRHELDDAVAEIRQQGYRDIRIDGAFRLSTGFAAGAAAPRAAGLTVAFRDWSSTGARADFPVAVTEHEVGQGDELAIALAVSGALTDDVLDYLAANLVPVEKLVVIEPASGPGQTSIPGEAEALGFVYSAFDEIRNASRKRAKLHLFANSPNGVGILLGHLWNRVPPTQLYDDANSAKGYFPTLLLAS